ncbi:MAG TPA: pyridoxal phosphate-dependent aminotransferase family protein [Candidatus Cloacimonas sp.]|nr:pyridoxal phosphate-dependent aminotransferase family protein [Candidatus Cloacimonas sp.]HNQ39175.1 pyridoxal phosphate-dependent aminotransferase family protein [Candidatus Cloacimonas sp.]HNS83969.1 pyridoxal phosphate-dependent aminotransferase family protein [Candidatus Cloacimonas sp.]HQC31344.1 pyridoxal phosphate-dependent aminotransferase family protein [Candidatus Cloacimonas sp.]HQM03209.1 pyridoxal phosphate-dependent aminotransferase family protein [Candidatus Cloacimonas sp.]
MSLLDKCYKFTDARKVMAMGYYPYFREITSEQDTEVICNGKKMLMLGSNSYLGLTNHPKVKEAAVKAIKKYGSGCAGSRFLNGTLDIHLELENELAKLVGKESAICYPTGYQANVGCISAMVNKNEFIITDKYDHASIIDGALLAEGKMLRFKHNDMASLERVLKEIKGKNSLIAVDGIFSMEGDIANLPMIIELAEKYNAEVMVDEAHSLGVLGNKGAGTTAHFGLTNKTAFIMGTFSKSLASVGGFIAADEALIHYLKHKSRALIFSASLPPASTASVLAALKIMQEEPERIAKLWENTNYMLTEFKAMGYNTGASCTPVVPLHIGNMMITFNMWRRLGEEGVFINPVVPPAVPPNSCLIRTSFMATHTKEQLDMALEKFNIIGRELNII